MVERQILVCEDIHSTPHSVLSANGVKRTNFY